MMRWRRYALVLGGLLACGPSFMDGLTGGKKAASDGGTGRDGGTSKDGGPRECVPAVPPSRPDGGDGRGTDILFAVRALRTDTRTDVDAAAPPAKGFDLDGVCTCPTEPRSCVPRDAGSEQCDNPDGRDNQLGLMFNGLADFVPAFKEDFADTAIRRGRNTVLVSVRDWNGAPDDSQVVVSILGSQNFDQTSSGVTMPRFDGNDTWTVEPSSLINGDALIGQDCRTASCAPAVTRVDPAAYVRDGTLVARFPNLAPRAPILIQTALGRMTFDFDELTLVAKLEAGSLQGELIGKWPNDRLLAAFGNIENFFDESQRICQSADGGAFDLYTGTKDAICISLDLGANNGPCTSVSSALSFLAVPAQPFSTVFKRNEQPSPCDNWKDDCSK